MVEVSEPGTEAPPAPPGVVDQFAVLFQFDIEEEIQYLDMAIGSCVPKSKDELNRLEDYLADRVAECSATLLERKEL